MTENSQNGSNPLKRFFGPMVRTVLVGLSGILVFMISIFTMMPLRMAENPVVNYNLFYTPIMALILFALFFRGSIEKDEGRQVIYGYLAAMVAWPLIGEVASMPLEKGIITQFSDVNIKVLGGWFYVVVGWVLLFIMWRTKSIKNFLATFLMIFLSIWSFELYMDNYSSRVSLDMMPVIANIVAIVSLVAAVVLLLIARKAETTAKKNALGAFLYILLSLIIMGSGQWKKPQDFYIKYETKHIEHELKVLQQDLSHLMDLKVTLAKRQLKEISSSVSKLEKKHEQIDPALINEVKHIAKEDIEVLNNRLNNFMREKKALDKSMADIQKVNDEKSEAFKTEFKNLEEQIKQLKKDIKKPENYKWKHEHDRTLNSKEADDNTDKK